MVKEDEMDMMAMEALRRLRDAVRVFNEAYYGDRMNIVSMLKEQMSAQKSQPPQLQSQPAFPSPSAEPVPPVPPVPVGQKGLG